MVSLLRKKEDIMATKTFEELKQLAIQIRDEKTNKQNTATRIGTQMLEHLEKLEQDYYDKTATDEELKQRDEKLSELSSELSLELNKEFLPDDDFIDNYYLTEIDGEPISNNEFRYKILEIEKDGELSVKGIGGNSVNLLYLYRENRLIFKYNMKESEGYIKVHVKRRDKVIINDKKSDFRCYICENPLVSSVVNYIDINQKKIESNFTDITGEITWYHGVIYADGNINYSNDNACFSNVINVKNNTKYSIINKYGYRIFYCEIENDKIKNRIEILDNTVVTKLNKIILVVISDNVINRNDTGVCICNLLQNNEDFDDVIYNGKLDFYIHKFFTVNLDYKIDLCVYKLEIGDFFCFKGETKTTERTSHFLKLNPDSHYEVKTVGGETFNPILLLDKNCKVIQTYNTTNNEYFTQEFNNKYAYYAIIVSTTNKDFYVKETEAYTNKERYISTSTAVNFSFYNLYFKSKCLDFSAYSWWTSPHAVHYTSDDIDITAVAVTDYWGYLSIALRNNKTGEWQIDNVYSTIEDDHNGPACVIINDKLYVFYSTGHAVRENIKLTVFTNLNDLRIKEEYEYITGDGNLTTYAQVKETNNYFFVFFRVTEGESGWWYCKINKSNLSEYTIIKSTDAHYILFSDTTTENIIRMMMYAHPKSSTNSIRQVFFNLDTEKIIDNEGEELGDFSYLSSAYNSSDSIISVNTSNGEKNNIRLLDVAVTDIDTLVFTYAMFTLAADDGVYFLYKDNESIMLCESGAPFYIASSYLPGATINPYDADIVYVALEKNGYKYLMSIDTITNKKKIIDKSSSWLLRPVFVKNSNELIYQIGSYIQDSFAGCKLYIKSIAP